MLESAVLGVFAVLIFLGIIAVSFYIILRFFHLKDSGRYIFLIEADKDKRHIAYSMYSEKMRMQLLNERGIVVVLDLSMDEYEKRICEKLCQTQSGMYVIPPDKINELISKEGL